MSSGTYHPKPEHKFSFGLWTIGKLGPGESICMTTI